SLTGLLLSILPVQKEKLTQENGSLRFFHVLQVVVNSRRAAFLPGVFKAKANLIDALSLHGRQAIEQGSACVVHTFWQAYWRRALPAKETGPEYSVQLPSPIQSCEFPRKTQSICCGGAHGHSIKIPSSQAVEVRALFLVAAMERHRGIMD